MIQSSGKILTALIEMSSQENFARKNNLRKKWCKFSVNLMADELEWPRCYLSFTKTKQNFQLTKI